MWDLYWNLLLLSFKIRTKEASMPKKETGFDEAEDWNQSFRDMEQKK